MKIKVVRLIIIGLTMRSIVLLSLIVILFLGGSFGKVTTYNRTIKLELNEIFTYPLPNQSLLYYNIRSSLGLAFSVRAIAEDGNKQPYYYPELALENTTEAIMTKSYQLNPAYSNLHLMVINEEDSGSVEKLSIFIEYNTKDLDAPPDSWINHNGGIIAFWCTIAVVGISIIIFAFVLVIRRRYQQPMIDLQQASEQDPLIQVKV